MRHQPADGAIANLLHRLGDHVVVAPAEAGDEREVLRLRQLLRRDDLAHARGVGRARLLAEDVLVGVHRRGEVLWAEAGRRRQQHDVDAAVDHLVVRVEPDERVAHVELHLRPELGAALQPRRRLSHDRLVDVGDRGQLVVGIRGEGLPGGAAAAPAAADQADLDGVGHRLARDDAGETGDEHAGGRPGLLEKVAPFYLLRIVFNRHDVLTA